VRRQLVSGEGGKSSESFGLAGTDKEAFTAATLQGTPPGTPFLALSLNLVFTAVVYIFFG